jgi:hypothetical protein
MTSKAALLALLTVWGVGSVACPPALADDNPAETQADDSDDDNDLTNRVWVRSDGGQLPGSMKIFLSDGSLVQDSCWETHRLSEWQQVSATTVTWNEDGTEIAAEIVSLAPDKLVLSLKLAGGATEEQHYVPSPVPYVCPEIPKG